MARMAFKKSTISFHVNGLVDPGSFAESMENSMLH